MHIKAHIGYRRIENCGTKDSLSSGFCSKQSFNRCLEEGIIISRLDHGRSRHLWHSFLIKELDREIPTWVPSQTLISVDTIEIYILFIAFVRDSSEGIS